MKKRIFDLKTAIYKKAEYYEDQPDFQSGQKVSNVTLEKLQPGFIYTIEVTANETEGSWIFTYNPQTSGITAAYGSRTVPISLIQMDNERHPRSGDARYIQRGNRFERGMYLRIYVENTDTRFNKGLGKIESILIKSSPVNPQENQPQEVNPQENQHIEGLWNDMQVNSLDQVYKDLEAKRAKYKRDKENNQNGNIL